MILLYTSYVTFQNGLLSALPFFLNWIFANACGFLADYFISNGKLSRAVVRKSFTAVWMVGPTVALTALAYNGCNPKLALIYLCMGHMLGGAAYSGFNINTVELAPNYAGTLRGITSTIANTNGFSAPALIGYITNGNVCLTVKTIYCPMKHLIILQQDLKHWKIVFLIAAGMYLGGGIVFIVFGRTETQPWNTYWEMEQKHLDTEKSSYKNEIKMK